MFNPAATYRIQFHKDFTFTDLEKNIPYLIKLGISTIYASPIFEAVPGSMHGYDTVNPLKINPEIGTIAQLRSISKKLRSAGIGWLQDIVPNHMAYHSNNPWLMDVLEKGPLSVYKGYFDQSLASDLYEGPIMAPFLGLPLATVIENGELNIAWKCDKLVFCYFDNYWPLQLASYPAVFPGIEAKVSEIQKINDAAGFSKAMDDFKQQLAAGKEINKLITALNKDKKQLANIAGGQYYRLCGWQETDQQINYRRFFTVNGLICLNIQQKEVFDHFHQLINALLTEGVFQGLRIDHIDGLYDPNQYLNDLRKLTGNDTYIVVEKILEQGEIMSGWPIQGSTGYDFLATVNNLFTSNKSRKSFTAFYKELTDDVKPVHEQITEKKTYILAHHMAGELDNLTALFLKLKLAGKDDLSPIRFDDLKSAIGQFLINCPVYKYYGDQFPLNGQEYLAVKRILQDIKDKYEELVPATSLLEKVLLEQPAEANKAYNKKALEFYRRLMQFTGPLMAKGVEDTLMYTYNRFIDHNEVGDSPDAFGISIADFHQQMELRQQHWPLAMNGTSTHDTKRGEDVRSRLNVLSDMGDEWLKTLYAWQQMNVDFKTNGAPDINDELFIYQTLIGAYPMPGTGKDNFTKRIAAYLEKTLREGKQHSDWATPDENYETAAKLFAAKLLDEKGLFWNSFDGILHQVADFGIVNSLSQVLLKFTCPGIPDVYQGCEHWDLSLVDPDNRRPVDYPSRNRFLKEIQDGVSERQVKSFWQNRFDGQIKIWLTHILLTERKQHADFFKNADYLPLKVTGKYKEHVIAYARRFKNTWYIVATPLNVAELCVAQQVAVLALDWHDTQIILPEDAPAQYADLLLNTKGKIKQQLEVKALFTHVPLAFLKLEAPAHNRSAGILMPVFSLASPFGIGDFGPGGKSFVDLLSRCGQTYWQLLPLSPVEAANEYSPYSSNSSMAGNVLFISPQLLVDDGLLTIVDVDKYIIKGTGKVSYKHVEKAKNILFEKAWKNFKSDGAPYLQKGFEQFCEAEAYWLDDYALYGQLKQQHKNKPWHQWPDEYKLKHNDALTEFAGGNADPIRKIKWLQFIFAKQWKELKAYGNEKGIRMFGDLPFYISYDSVDVWAHPELFSLAENLEMKFVAGVPPDYFNADGQLWGMPVFNWDKLQETNFDWWTKRIKKNLELFDLLRLDHFRAFSTYWAVPNGEKTAINGKWESAPGDALFTALQKQIGKLPLVAEDLGDIDEAVYTLRDKFGMPGMKVLQFAFGGDMPGSPHIPHNYGENYIAYTGTHDNNTAAGWFKEDADAETRRHLQKYAGVKVNGDNVNEILIRLAMASVAKMVIVPLQDWLGFDEGARINTPAGIVENWRWRITDKEMRKIPEQKIRHWSNRYLRV